MGSDVGEVGVEGDENATFLAAERRDFRISGAAKSLIEDCGHIVSGPTEKAREFYGEVLVQLEAHSGG